MNGCGGGPCCCGGGCGGPCWCAGPAWCGGLRSSGGACCNCSSAGCPLGRNPIGGRTSLPSSGAVPSTFDWKPAGTEVGGARCGSDLDKSCKLERAAPPEVGGGALVASGSNSPAMLALSRSLSFVERCSFSRFSAPLAAPLGPERPPELPAEVLRLALEAVGPFVNACADGGAVSGSRESRSVFTRSRTC